MDGRRVVSNLPVETWNASGKRCKIRTRLDQRQATAKERHNARGVTDLAELSRGHHVRTRHPITHRWEAGRIVEKCLQPRSYRVESPSGRILQKNRRYIRETAEKHVFLNPDDDPQRDTREVAANRPRPITVEPHANSSESSTAEPVEPPVVTPASVDPAEELAGSLTNVWDSSLSRRATTFAQEGWTNHRAITMCKPLDMTTFM